MDEPEASIYQLSKDDYSNFIKELTHSREILELSRQPTGTIINTENIPNTSIFGRYFETICIITKLGTTTRIKSLCDTYYNPENITIIIFEENPSKEVLEKHPNIDYKSVSQIFERKVKNYTKEKTKELKLVY